MRAAIYTRFSSDRQREASSEDQARNCRKRIDAERWQLVEHFKDEAISGATSARPGYQAMLEAGLAQRFDVLLVDDLSRLSRDQVESERAIRRLEHIGVRILAVSDGYDSQSKGRKVHRGVKSLMNELYLDDLRDKTHRGLTGRALAKFSAGGLPYGYRSLPVLEEARGSVIGYQRQAHPVHAPIVCEIFVRSAAGEPMKAIASDLNARGVPSPGAAWRRTSRRHDGRWLVSALHAMLHNEMYVGRYVWNRSTWVKDPETGQRLRRERPESEWIIHEMPELALIDVATWSAVERRLSARRCAFAGGRGGLPKYLLSGLLRCDQCGAAMILIGDKPRRYVCSTYHHGGASACDMKLGTQRDIAETRILAEIERDLLAPAAIELAVSEMRRLWQEDGERPIVDASPELARLDRERGELERLVQGGTLSGSTAAPALERIETQRRSLHQTAQVERTSSVRGTLFGAESAYREVVGRIREVVQGSDIAVAREALRELLGEVPVRPAASGEYLEAHLRLGPVALQKAAGAEREWIGSGGNVWIHSRWISLARSQ